MAKNTFTTFDLNKLVDESINEADEIQAELKTIDENQLTFPAEEEESDDYLAESEKTFGETKNVIEKDTGSAISFNYVYKKIGDLIDKGNTSLDMLQAIDLDVADPALIGQAASLMNAIRGCISEFTKIHLQWVRFNNALKIEQQRLANKKELLRFKNNLANGTEGQAQASNLVEVTPSEIIEFLNWKKQKEEAENEKNNKI